MRTTCVVLVACVAGGAWAAAQAPAPALADLLGRAAAYLDQYEARFSAVISDEDYHQEAHEAVNGHLIGRRTTKSQLLVMNAGDDNWLAFRDVFQVDGKPLPDHIARLEQLFAQPASASADALLQAGRITEESSRYNVGSLRRNINVPTMALTYLKRAHQSGSAFDLEGTENVSGTRARIVGFNERADVAIVHGTNGHNVPAEGRFWIDPTGRVVRTELVLDDAVSGVKAKLTVTYAPRPVLNMWVPASMKESYTIARQETIDASASYSNFRSVSVSVDVKVKQPGGGGGGGG